MSKKIALMCGHGTQTNGVWDSGTSYEGYTEAALMLPITKAAVKQLRANGLTVISDADTNNNKNMTKDVQWANKEKADIYVSVHCDYSKAPTGVMPLYVSVKGKELATALNTAIKNGMPMKSRGVVKRTDLYELNATDMPACILETGSIKADLKILKNDYEKYGKLIAQGIMDYLGVKPKSDEKKTETLYRVRKSWSDAKSQVGAFKSLDNAKAECNKHAGYSVYDQNGKVVYTNNAISSKAAKLVAKAKELAWPKGTEKSKYAWKGGKPTDAFKKALNAVYPSRSSWGTAAKAGCSCDVFVGTCVRATLDGNFPRGFRDQFKYESKVFEKHTYKNVTPYSVSKDGDIVGYYKDAKREHCHIVIRGNGMIYEAQHEMTYGHVNTSLSKLKTKMPEVVVFRAK